MPTPPSSAETPHSRRPSHASPPVAQRVSPVGHSIRPIGHNIRPMAVAVDIAVAIAIAIIGSAGLVACADITAPADDTPMATDSTTNTADTLLSDGSEPSDSIDDTQVQDSGSADTVAPQDSAGATTCACPATVTGPLGVGVIYHPASDSPPTLAGNAAGSLSPNGDYIMTAVDIHPGSSVSDQVTLTLSDAGGTTGAATFIPSGANAGRWHLAMTLNVDLSVTAFGYSDTVKSDSSFSAGGCHTFDGAALSTDFDAACLNGWPSENAPPGEAQFAHDSGAGTLMIQFDLSQQTMLALVPEDSRDLAASFITGPLKMTATFTRP